MPRSAGVHVARSVISNPRTLSRSELAYPACPITRALDKYCTRWLCHWYQNVFISFFVSFSNISSRLYPQLDFRIRGEFHQFKRSYHGHSRHQNMPTLPKVYCVKCNSRCLIGSPEPLSAFHKSIMILWSCRGWWFHPKAAQSHGNLRLPSFISASQVRNWILNRRALHVEGYYYSFLFTINSHFFE